MSTNVIQFPGRIPVWSLADRLRKVRRDMGYTIEQMAVALEVGDKRYGAWESGRNTPSDTAALAVKLEDLTGVPRTWFLGWADEPQPDGPDGGSTIEHVMNRSRVRFPQVAPIVPIGLAA